MKLEWLKQSHNMVDIIHGVIPYDGLEAKIIDSPTFARLQRVMQSSLAYMNYPSNKVHRYEHSIGVMHLAGLFFFHSISNSEDDDVKRKIEGGKNGRLFSTHIPLRLRLKSENCTMWPAGKRICAAFAG